MDNQIDEIKKRIDIVDFIGGYVEVKKTGRNFKACCPFHQEKTPSFVISPDRQIWHCFGSCGDGGDIIKFLMKWENITFYEALKELADKVGVKLESVGFEDKEWSVKDKIIKVNNAAASFFEYLLQQTSFGEHARQYLLNRKVNLLIAKKFQLGYAPQSWDSLLKFLKKKGFSEEDQFQAGLLVKNESGHYYDRFRGRLMFPIRDTKAHVIGFSGRLLGTDDKAAKYVNSPETPIYHKRESLFGIHLAKDAIRKEGNVLLVEGEFDMITPYMHGIEHVVAIKGSAVTQDQLTILKRYTQKITLALDSDAAGEEAIKRGINEAEKQELEIQVVKFSSGKDPDEAARNNFIQFKKDLQSPVPLYDFLINVAKEKYPDQTPFHKKKIGDEILPVLSQIQNPIVQSHYIRALAQLLEVSEVSIQDTLKKKNRQKTQTSRHFVKKDQEIMPRNEMMQRYLMSCLLQSEHVYETATIIFTDIKPEDFSIPSLGKIAQEFLNYKSSHQHFDVKDFFSVLPSELSVVADEIFLYATSSLEYADQDLKKLVYEVKKDGLKKKMTMLLSQESDRSQDADIEVSKIDAELKELDKKYKIV